MDKELKEILKNIDIIRKNNKDEKINNFLNDIVSNIDQINKYQSSRKVVLIDKNSIKNKKKIRKNIKIKNILFRVQKKQLDKLKEYIGLSILNVQTNILEIENNVLTKINSVKDLTDNIKYRLENRQGLKNIAKKKYDHIKNKITTLSSSALNLLKQKIKFEENTIRFKNVYQNIQAKGIEKQNQILNGLVITKGNVKKKVVNIKNKLELKKKKIVDKVVKKKQVIVNVSKQKVDSVKKFIKDKYLYAETFVGVNALNLKEKIVDTKDTIVTKACVKATDLKDYTIDSALYLKDRISRKFMSTKNIIARKTGMQIALFKADLKKKFNNIMDVNIEKQLKLQDRIKELKEQRQMLINNLIKSEPEKNSMVK